MLRADEFDFCLFGNYVVARRLSCGEFFVSEYVDADPASATLGTFVFSPSGAVVAIDGWEGPELGTRVRPERIVHAITLGRRVLAEHARA